MLNERPGGGGGRFDPPGTVKVLFQKSKESISKILLNYLLKILLNYLVIQQ